MTRPELQAKIRDLVREVKRLRRQLRGPRARAARKARQAERRKRIKAACNEWITIKLAVNERAGGICECRNGVRCTSTGWISDHFWGGIGRRRQMQTAESVWLLCALHNESRTLNRPSREWWLDSFQEHVLANGLKSQVPLIERERARIEGKGRP